MLATTCRLVEGQEGLSSENVALFLSGCLVGLGDAAIVESHARSIVKAVSYRVWGTLATALIAWVFTHRKDVSLAIGLSDMVVKVIVYYLHERAWSRLGFGRVAKPRSEA